MSLSANVDGVVEVMSRYLRVVAISPPIKIDRSSIVPFTLSTLETNGIFFESAVALTYQTFSQFLKKK
jgi:hypothetical protein